MPDINRLIVPKLPTAEKKFYGKYRGTVVNNNDPNQLARIQVSVLAVLGQAVSSWAVACVPFAGSDYGILAIPAVGTEVWVEFESGDSARPIWTGCAWNGATRPPQEVSAQPQRIVLKTQSQNLLLIADDPATPVSGGITLRSTAGATIVVNDSGIYINNGKGASITLTGAEVRINNVPAKP